MALRTPRREPQTRQDRKATSFYHATDGDDPEQAAAAAPALTASVEVEVAAIAGKELCISRPAWVVLPEGADWHDTTSKYSLATGLEPLDRDHPATRILQRITRTLVESIPLGGAVRMDYFLRPSGDVYVGEVNCLPGHGIASTFPRIFELSGVSRTRQFELMIESAIFLYGKRGEAFARF